MTQTMEEGRANYPTFYPEYLVFFLKKILHMWAIASIAVDLASVPRKHVPRLIVIF